jgi:glycosyltransferase involved in cell wall biosynthesis
VFTSLHKTFGLAAVEAANNGVPVVSHDFDVMREVLSVDGSPCARFADVRDLPALQSAVRDVLGDPVLAATLIERGGRLREKDALDTMVDAYTALLANNGVQVPAAR